MSINVEMLRTSLYLKKFSVDINLVIPQEVEDVLDVMLLGLVGPVLGLMIS